MTSRVFGLFVSDDGAHLWLWGGRGVSVKRTERLLFSERNRIGCRVFALPFRFSLVLYGSRA